MPIYEYLCQSCNHELEVIQKLSEDLLKICPACEKPKLKKKISASAFRLSGNGWYETDFKTGDKKNLVGEKQPKSEGGDKSGGGESSKSKSEGGKGDSKKGGSGSGSDSKSKSAATGS
ncbi:MAG: FmdB family transcriptional regulator [Cellvibrionales bacterium]|nr:MAG: FmdB family transcriptional regulator [Cellvibrionales bacterium]